jgi:hypothetical protein
MRIGLSYSRCVRDIVEGKVGIRDVLVIIARTDFDPHDDDQWKGIWQGYGGGNGGAGSIWSMPEWGNYADEDEGRFRSVSIELFEMGKLHQPRKFGANPQRLPYYWLETVLIDSDIEKNPAAKLAWDQFQILAELSSIGISPTL